MKHAIAAVLICAALPFVVQAKADAVDKTVIPHTPCPTEDSTFCVWDARHMGNGEGKSFLALKDGTMVFIRHHWAHKLTHKG